MPAAQEDARVSERRRATRRLSHIDEFDRRIAERFTGARTAPSEADDHFRAISRRDVEAAVAANDAVTCDEAYAAMRPFLTRGGLPDTAVWRSIEAEFRSDREDGLV